MEEPPSSSIQSLLGNDNPEAAQEVAQTKEAKREARQNSGPRAPWVPLATSARVIRLFTIACICLVITVLALASIVFTQLSKKPWVVGYNQGQYSELTPERFRVTRDDVELFLGDVIPKLYGNVRGEAPALDMLRTMVNPNILSTQKKNLKDQKNLLEDQGISQFAIVTGIIPETLVINRSQNYIYAEATGVVMLTKEDKSTPTEVQWRTLLYIVDPLPSLETNTPGGRIVGNQYGLYLQQIMEQSPGTVNTDSPRPTTQDEQERREQELRKQKNNMPSIQIGTEN